MLGYMKTAGNILSVLFDEGFVSKAQGYSKLFDSWTDITAKNGIPAAADYSRVKELDRGVLLIEIDHPGWKQILQTKQSKILNDFRYRFPDQDISAISLILSKGRPKTAEEPPPEPQTPPQQAAEQAIITEPPPPPPGLDAITDDDFKETLIKLGKSIAERENT
jgi:hypothetical protein